MRQQAMENLLKLFEQAVDEGDEKMLKALSLKSYILRKRDGSEASVIRELVNRRV